MGESEEIVERLKASIRDAKRLHEELNKSIEEMDKVLNKLRDERKRISNSKKPK